MHSKLEKKIYTPIQRLRIGYISYEHPLGIAGGGIGTYLGQIARIMTRAGHEVEVFTGHQEFTESLEYDGYILHRVHSDSASDFRKKIVDVFTERQQVSPFDVIEAAEYGADALYIKKKFPQLPLVIKLHTPSYLTQELNEYKPTLFDKLRFYLGGIVRGRFPDPYWIYKKEDDLEYEQYCLADSLCSPSKSLAELIKLTWSNSIKVEVIPNPFVPDPSFLNVPIKEPNANQLVVGFFGRLEKRKGILVLMEAIPKILKRNSHFLFHFVGKSHPSPTKGLDMEAYLKF